MALEARVKVQIPKILGKRFSGSFQRIAVKIELAMLSGRNSYSLLF